MSDGGSSNGHEFARASEIKRLDHRIDEKGDAFDRAVAQIVEREIRLGARFSSLERNLVLAQTATNNLGLSLGDRLNHISDEQYRQGVMLELLLRSKGIDVP